MANKKLQAKDLIGLSIYHDPKYGTIFYDILSKKAYQLINQDVRNYNIYTAMMPLCAVIAYVCNLWFKVPFVGCLIVFLVLWLITELGARYLFFYKLPVLNNWKKFKKESIFDFMAKNYTGLRLLILTLLLVTIAVVMVVNARMEGFEGANLYASYAISAGALVFAVISIISFIIKKVKKYPDIIRKQ